MMEISKYEDLFFKFTVESYVKDNKRFLKRDWLADEVAERLKKPGCRFVFLTAEPGAGRSTFLAQLSDDNQDWLRYFIHHDQRIPIGGGRKE